MLVTGIAINADASCLDGQIERLQRELDYYLQFGFTHVELAPHGVGVIYNGKLQRERLNDLLALLKKYPYQYVVHGPNPLNLMNWEHLDCERDLFKASLQFTAEIGANLMVYHAGRYLPEEKFLLPNLTKPSPEEKTALWNLELHALREMGDWAQGLGITIAVENARPYLDASPYCYGEYLAELAAMVREVNHPQVGITLDAGHAYLAARYHGYDLLSGVNLVAPYVKHLHLHDNFGKGCSSFERKSHETPATGRGDLHLPIGWGTVPLGDILAILRDYTGIITLEIRPRYRTYYAEALEKAKVLLDM